MAAHDGVSNYGNAGTLEASGSIIFDFRHASDFDFIIHIKYLVQVLLQEIRDTNL